MVDGTESSGGRDRREAGSASDEVEVFGFSVEMLLVERRGCSTAGGRELTGDVSVFGFYGARSGS